VDITAALRVIIHVARELTFNVLNVVGIRQTVLRQDMHQLEEVVLDFVRILLFVVGLVECSLRVHASFRVRD